MKRTILRIAPLPAAKLAMVFWFITGALLTVPQYLSLPPGLEPPLWLWIALPFVQAFLGAILTFLLCALYNFLAPRWSAIEVTVTEA